MSQLFSSSAFASNKRLVVAAMLAALIVGRAVVGEPERAGAAIFPLPAGATLEFEADGIDGPFGDTVEVGDQTTPLAENVVGFETVRVAVDPGMLRSGRVDVAVLAGDVGASANEQYDDFGVRDVRLVLADGTVVTDDRYTPGRPYHVGDGHSVSEDPTDVVRTIPGGDFVDYFGTPLAHTSRVLKREFRFILPLTARSAADAPTVPDVTKGTDQVRVSAKDPDGGALRVEVLAAEEATLVSAQAGLGYSKPHESSPGVTTVDLQDADASKLLALDGDALTTTTTQGIPTQEFTVQVDPASVSGMPHLEVMWQGRTSKGGGATLYVRDLRREVWAEVASTENADADTVLSGAIDVASTVAEDGSVRLQVQEHRFTPTETDFSIAWTTDTQYLSERYRHIYEAMNTWIVDNAEEQNIVYTIHTGDLVQNHNQYPWEWERASSSMQILEQGDMPYGVVTGNHDVGDNPLPVGGDHLFYDQFFPVSRFEGIQTEHYSYGGHYGENNRNHYDLVSYGGVDFLFLYLDYLHGDAEIAWADEVLKAHPDRHVVLATHTYINIDGSYSGNGSKLFNELVLDNPNVFMFLCGHHHGAAYNVRRIPLVGGGTRVFFEVLHDYQDGPDGGSGYLRLMRFDLDDLQMDQQPYSPYTDDFDYGARGSAIPEEHDDYTLSLDIGAVHRELATDRVALLVRTGEVVASRDGVASGSEATVMLPTDLPDALVVRLTDPEGGVAESRPLLGT